MESRTVFSVVSSILSVLFLFLILGVETWILVIERFLFAGSSVIDQRFAFSFFLSWEN